MIVNPNRWNCRHYSEHHYHQRNLRDHFGPTPRRPSSHLGNHFVVVNLGYLLMKLLEPVFSKNFHQLQCIVPDETTNECRSFGTLRIRLDCGKVYWCYSVLKWRRFYLKFRTLLENLGSHFIGCPDNYFLILEVHLTHLLVDVQLLVFVRMPL